MGFIELTAKTVLVPVTILINLQSLITLHASVHRYNIFRAAGIALVSFSLLSSTVAPSKSILARIYYGLLCLLMLALGAINCWVDSIVFQRNDAIASGVLALTPFVAVLPFRQLKRGPTIVS